MAEDPKERLNRELIELLNELRVALPGIQIIFAFLLAVPFTQRWEATTPVQRYAFFGAILAATVATALLMAPTTYHRLRFRQRDKRRMLATANRLTIAGTAFMATAMSLVVFVVTDVVFDAWVAAAVGAGAVLLFGWFWYGLPISRRVDDEERG